MSEAGTAMAGSKFWFLALTLVLPAAFAQPAASPTVPPPPRSAAAKIAPPPRSEDGVRWQGLTAAQREVLAPLQKDWPAIDASRKQKWIAIADRFHSLPPAERGRISERMTEWSRLSPAERGELRLRYQEAKQVPAPDRSARWEAYQNLPPEQKQQLAARAAPPREAASAPKVREPGGGAKANVVPNPALVQPPRSVAPTVVQATPGATTRLITRPVAPPAHQQSGLPKIATTSEFVNRSTLLPRRGPQAAAVATPTPATPATARPAEAKPAR